jgi:hypothetical protein
MKQWVHLAAVFQRPHITTYVNGKQVGSATWDYPVGHRGEIQVGRWTGAASHRGLIDDVRIYRRALDAEQVRELADSTGRQSPEYQDLGPARDVANELARFETRWSTLTVGDNGTLLSLREKGTGRELLEAPHPVLSVEQTSQRRLQARRMRYEDGLLIAEFPRGGGSAAIRIESREDYLTVTAAALDVPDVQRFTFFQIAPAPTSIWDHEPDWHPTTLGRLPAQPGHRGRYLVPRTGAGFRAWTTAEHGLLGHRVGLVAGPRECLIPALRSMAENENVPKSRAGGPWAWAPRRTAVPTCSPIWPPRTPMPGSSWLAAAGSPTSTLHGWWDTLGHYEPRAAYFPGGWKT